MCIAIYKTQDNKISKSTLKNCFDNNPDGAGFCYRKDTYSQITMKKGYFTFKEFWGDYKKIDNSNEVLIHFRIGTSGLMDKDNCHPFLINGKDYLIHNGILKDFPTTKTKSDTNYLCSNLLKGLDVTNYNLQRILEISIRDNKIILMPELSEVVILNEHLGKWINGNWFSNTSYQSCNWKYSNNYTAFPYLLHNTVKEDKEILSMEDYNEMCKREYFTDSELKEIYKRYPELEDKSLEDMEDALFHKHDFDVMTGKLI